jgi:hypothetical protein
MDKEKQSGGKGGNSLIGRNLTLIKVGKPDARKRK